jgi:hypothetical protein
MANETTGTGVTGSEKSVRYILITVLLLTLLGCAGYPVNKETQIDAGLCLGSSDLPADLTEMFEPVEDKQLLSEALGNPGEGKLCQGQVFKSKKIHDGTVFRAWNSTNPNSKFGNWWAFQKPVGKISAYRSGYEICYQWSPLDKLVRCTLKPGTKIVLGTGQSAECSKYLTYPVSDKQQVFIPDAAMVLTNCKVFDGVFSWE